MSSTIPSKRPSGIDPHAEAKRRADEVRARIAASLQASAAGTASAAKSAAPAAGSTAGGSGVDKLADIKARIAAAMKGNSKPIAATPSPAVARPSDSADRFAAAAQGRGGLGVGLHPALLEDSKAKTRDDDKKKGGRGSWKQREKEKQGKPLANPYLPESGNVAPARKQRELHFNHNMQSRPAMQAANEMRKKAALEAMKKRIDEKTRAAGLDDGIPIHNFAVPMPPDIEFWDEGLQGTDLDRNELISNLVIHPIQIEPPQERLIQLKPAPLMLTRKEQRKMRRIRRADEHKEEQAKIRLGLAPQPEPKVNHKNVMRVYGEMAVKDPTAVEALVNRQIRERRETHEESNDSRRLTKEQKEEKRKEKAEANAAMGLQMAVYRIALTKETLLPKHRFYINLNAQQRHDITGVVLVGPSLTLALIEAGEHSQKQYKRLMLHRVKWQAILEGGGDAQHAATDHDGTEQGDKEDNRDQTCQLLWEGQVRDRKFKKWGGIREVETELQAVDALKRMKLETFWTLAKSSGNVS